MTTIAQVVDGQTIATVPDLAVISAVAAQAGARAATTYTPKSATYAATVGDRILADTSAGEWTLTLPVSPSAGDSIAIIDSAATFDIYPLTIARNGETIDDEAEDLVADVAGAAFILIFNGSTWIVT